MIVEWRRRRGKMLNDPMKVKVLFSSWKLEEDWLLILLLGLTIPAFFD